MNIGLMALTLAATALLVTCANAAVGFQQMGERHPILSLDFVSPPLPELQKTTVFSVGIPVNAKSLEAAREGIRLLVTSTGPAIAKSGMGQVNATAVE